MRNRLTFGLERWIQRGATHQLLLIAALVVLVAVAAGAVALLFGRMFDSLGEASWWAFLRLTDPGYLGDDEGALLRTLSTSVTIVGYVLFMGSLIAIMTQWLSSTLRTLEAGLTPIALEGHLLILGWTNRTPEVVHEIVLAEGRVRRFLQRSGVRSLRIVILAQELGPDLRLELKSQLGSAWRESQIVFRSGSSLRFEHLERVNAMKAALIVIPGANFVMGGAAATDARVVKTILSLVSFGHSSGSDSLPPVVAEIFDASTSAVIRDVYRGPIELIPSDMLISRLLVQNVRHQGLSRVYGELLSHRYGNEVYVRPVPEFAGSSWSEIEGRYLRAIPIGVVRPAGGSHRPFLNPPGEFRFEADDRLVFIAGDFESTLPDAPAAPPEQIEGPTGIAPSADPPAKQHRLLVLGWSHMVRSLVQEFARHSGERFELDLLSLVPRSEREAALAHVAIDRERVGVRQIEGDYTLTADLERLDPAGYDTIVILGSDWLESDAASDARAILGYVQLRSLLPAAAAAADGQPGPKVVVELMDPENERLFTERLGEVIVSPLLLSHMLAHVALRPELGAVFDELFGPSRSEIRFRAAEGYGLTGEPVTIGSARRLARRRGEIALGFNLHKEDRQRGLRLNPGESEIFTLSDRDEIVVLTTNRPNDPHGRNGVDASR